MIDSYFRFSDRVFPSSIEVASYKHQAQGTNIFDRIEHLIEKNLHHASPLNPFDLDHRLYVAHKAIMLEAKLSIPRDDISKIYWGIASSRISKKSLEGSLGVKIRKIWEKCRNPETIAETLYKINNLTKWNSRIYDKRKMYTPVHKIQKFLEEAGLEIWSQEEEDLLVASVLYYDTVYPSFFRRKGVHTLQEFQIIAKMPYLQGVRKTPEQMMDQWNQRSSFWLIGQEILFQDIELLEILYHQSSSAWDLAEKFAEAKGGRYYPDRVIQKFWTQSLFAPDSKFIC